MLIDLYVVAMFLMLMCHRNKRKNERTEQQQKRCVGLILSFYTEENNLFTVKEKSDRLQDRSRHTITHKT